LDDMEKVPRTMKERTTAVVGEAVQLFCF